MSDLVIHETTVERFGVVTPGIAPPADVRRLRILLIKPSKYDDEGYVMRYVRGVLPSNTLAALRALTEEVAERGELGDIALDTVMLDEFVQKVDARRLVRRHGGHGTRLIVALCGVQTNQFPRAADLAREFVALGIPVLVGGFHVSGAIACSTRGIPPECQQLMDDGVTLVKGEVEEVWGDLLRDALHGRLRRFYDVKTPPDLSKANIPVVDPKLMKHYAYPQMGTIDAGRGCPFSCSFCTIINVQGRKMRNRTPEAIKRRIRDNARLKIDYYFFTDDNMARNPDWEGIFDALIELRRDEKLDISFMMQVDVVAYRIKNFMAKAADAGCTQVFIGMESINPANLKAAGKGQNNANDYVHMIEEWHRHGIACHVGYIIGFPFDTVESVHEDVRRLRDEIKVDMASFFMLTPLPGSKDHVDKLASGEWIEPDYNLFDSFHATTDHPNMTREEWFSLFQQVWHEFYTIDAMKQSLSKAGERTYWGLFNNFIWYRYSALIEATHPMIGGFFPIKDRLQRRPGTPIEPFLSHYWRRTRHMVRWTYQIVRLYFDMQEVWLATRGRRQIEEKIEDLQRKVEELRAKMGESASRAGEAVAHGYQQMRQGAGEALDRAGHSGRHAAETMLSGLNAQIERLRHRRARLDTPQRHGLARLNPFTLKRSTREPLNAYWSRTWNKLRTGRWYRINPLGVGVNLLRDAKYCLAFSLSMFGVMLRGERSERSERGE